MNKKNIKIAVIGGGNLGRTLSTILTSLGYDVELVCRDTHRAIRIDNSYCFEIDGDFGKKSYLVPFVTKIEYLTTKKDIIIFATKSFDMVNRITKCLPLLTPTGMLVSVQNVFTIDRLMELIPDESSVCMMCDFACHTVNKVTYVRNFNGVTLGVYNKQAINRMKLLNKIFSEFTTVNETHDVMGFTIGRNIINIAISILGGITGLLLKDILNNKTGRALFIRIIEECVTLCNAMNIKIMPYNNQLDYYQFLDKSINGCLYRYRIIKLLRSQNGDIKSSALNDLEHNKRTEITCLLDRLIDMAEKHNIEFKFIPLLNNILHEIEEDKRTIDKNIFTDSTLISKIKNK